MRCSEGPGRFPSPTDLPDKVGTATTSDGLVDACVWPDDTAPWVVSVFVRSAGGRRHQMATTADTHQEVDGVSTYEAHDTTGLFPDKKIRFTDQSVCW